MPPLNPSVKRGTTDPERLRCLLLVSANFNHSFDVLADYRVEEQSAVILRVNVLHGAPRNAYARNPRIPVATARARKMSTSASVACESPRSFIRLSISTCEDRARGQSVIESHAPSRAYESRRGCSRDRPCA